MLLRRCLRDYLQLEVGFNWALGSDLEVFRIFELRVQGSGRGTRLWPRPYLLVGACIMIYNPNGRVPDLTISMSSNTLSKVGRLVRKRHCRRLLLRWDRSLVQAKPMQRRIDPTEFQLGLPRRVR